MCVEITSVTITSRKIIAYKYVRPINNRSGKSEYPGRERAKQPGCKTSGKVFVYTIGKTLTSGDPGIFLYAKRPDYNYGVMRVEIPEGTVIARGIKDGDKAILAQTVKVLGWL